MSKIRVLLVDDHAVIREGLRALLSDDDDIIIVGEAGTPSEAVRLTLEKEPAVVILDIKLKEGSGVDACREIKKQRPETGVIMLSAFWDEAMIRTALQAGADGYLLKHADDLELPKNIRAVAEGRSILDQDLLDAVMHQLREPAEEKSLLTEQEGVCWHW